MRYMYKPEHPLADDSGFVTLDDYYMHKAYNEPDLRMMNGNTPVTFSYISDEMPATRHMSNGKRYTSKKKFRDETRARGCVEVGTEVKALTTAPKNIQKGMSKRERIDDIKKTIYQLKNNMVPR